MIAKQHLFTRSEIFVPFVKTFTHIWMYSTVGHCLTRDVIASLSVRHV